jgi:predicted RecA/RadA family phage recombinase
MKNYVMEGEQLELTAPVGGVVSGKAYKIGALIVVATVTKAAGEKFVGTTEGVVKMPKASALVLAEGAAVMHEDSTGEVVAAGGDWDFGYVVEAAPNGQAYALVKIKAV